MRNFLTISWLASLCHYRMLKLNISLQALFFFFGGIHFENPGINTEHCTCRPRFLSNCEISLASHAGVFRGARRDERLAPVKTPAWEAKISLAQQWHAKNRTCQRSIKIISIEKTVTLHNLHSKRTSLMEFFLKKDLDELY